MLRRIDNAWAVRRGGLWLVTVGAEKAAEIEGRKGQI
jgi:hypothetical protein